MKYVNVKLLTLMTSVIFMMTAGPAAFGQATNEPHAADLFPGTQMEPKNDVYQWASKSSASNTGDGSEFLDIISQFVFVYFSPSGAFSVNAGNYPACIATLPTSPGDMLWVLYHSTDAAKTTVTPVTASHIDVGVNSPSVIFFLNALAKGFNFGLYGIYFSSHFLKTHPCFPSVGGDLYTFDIISKSCTFHCY